MFTVVLQNPYKFQINRKESTAYAVTEKKCLYLEESINQQSRQILRQK